MLYIYTTCNIVYIFPYTHMSCDSACFIYILCILYYIIYSILYFLYYMLYIALYYIRLYQHFWMSAWLLRIDMTYISRIYNISWKELLHPFWVWRTGVPENGALEDALAGVRPQDILKRAFVICTHHPSSWVSLYRGSTQQTKMLGSAGLWNPTRGLALESWCGGPGRSVRQLSYIYIIYILIYIYCIYCVYKLTLVRT